MQYDLLNRRFTHFVLWQPGANNLPVLVLGKLIPGNPPTFSQVSKTALAPAVHPGLWELEAATLNMSDGVYHYWFEVDDTSPDGLGTLKCTDPFAYTVDYRLLSEPGYHPASVVAISGGRLVLNCDPGGETATIGNPPDLDSLSANNNLVIYELPASWSRAGVEGADSEERDVGTFSDVIALFNDRLAGANFSDLPEVSTRALLSELGINALELLPPADTKARREWGYATAHYFASDYDLGFPQGNQSPTATSDLVKLVQLCHSNGVRFFVDIVMAFGHDPYARIAFDAFHMKPSREKDNPDSYQSSRNSELRDPYGGESWRYVKQITCYDPESGNVSTITPAWLFHFAYINRWLNDFHVDGFRIDSVNNIANWSFLQEFRKRARGTFSSRYPTASTSARDAKFLVIGEELNVPVGLVTDKCVDALWNEGFQSRLRAAIIGESLSDENFEWTVRRMVDCRNLGFKDGAESIIYIGTHDTEGMRKERLYNFLENCGVYEKERRAKLAFACLLTSVGIPMIFAGDEFCDQQDRKAVHPSKQIDPVDYSRVRDPWRANVFTYTANLIDFRKRSPALGVNDTVFIHLDFEEGRRILAWVRGDSSKHDPVVVVANFSDHSTPGAEYRVHNWPVTPNGKQWREVTQQRVVPAPWVAREPMFPWEAKVYELV